jgi:hypothetical protein
MIKQRTLDFPLMGHLVRDVRQLAEEALQDLPKDLRDAVAMVASELVSNATKHGVSLPSAPTANITLSVSKDQIEVAVSNGVQSDTVAQEMQERLAQIAQAESKEQLYMDRLQQMLDDPTQTGRLGLLRIGFEGQFELRHTYANQVLTMIATRGLK